MLGTAEQRREARAGVDPRDAPPVDRARVVDERHRLRVADDRVVLDARGHAMRQPEVSVGPVDSDGRDVGNGVGSCPAQSMRAASGRSISADARLFVK